MKDVSGKPQTLRTALARAVLTLNPETTALVRAGRAPKGDPLAAARIAAVTAAKETSRIIPYCHPCPVEYVGVEFEVREESIEITTSVRAVYRTGVEMEALTAAAVAALTIYDMLKPVDEELAISGIRLLEKTGGLSTHGETRGSGRRAAVLVSSDRVSQGEREDLTGPALVERLEAEGFDVVELRIVPDEVPRITAALTELADEAGVDLLLTTGGTGLGPRDVTPEATAEVLDPGIPGIAEAARSYGQDRTPRAMLSRGRAGVRGRTLIVNLPGSLSGVREGLASLFPALHHALDMIAGRDHPTPGASA